MYNTRIGQGNLPSLRAFVRIIRLLHLEDISKKPTDIVQDDYVYIAQQKTTFAEHLNSCLSISLVLLSRICFIAKKDPRENDGNII